MDREKAKQKIKELVVKYESEKAAGRLRTYNEQNTKRIFIEPLFEALGWDMLEKSEVSAEETVVGDRADYGFFLNSKIQFFLEAKKFSVDLHREDFANQVVRYSWNKGVTWAVLTDFESIKVFCAQEIDKDLSDKFFFEIPADKYVERFDQLWWLSKDSFQKKILDTEAEKVGKKLNRVPISELLYRDLNKCREILTKTLADCNKNVDPILLDQGVQKILDRLIFLRVAEDRGIEPDTLKSLMREAEAKRDKDNSLYKTMVGKFRELKDIYNSNIFDEHTFESWDDYGDGTKDVVKILEGKKGYYEYDFKAMPADVLGAVYENYLGHKLAKAKKGLVVEKDARKRKEQGIYYTPSFIVDYIVQSALKPVLDKCKSISDLKKIKILDPACGSGSFLIKAMEVIYEKYTVDFMNRADSSTVKYGILLENIFGVDLDPQAVEVTRLNLLINALSERRKMPPLDKNIKNGNSLISGTDKELEKYFGKNYRDKKPFNWQEEFPEVFKQGGFDVVIGNPPYVQSRNLNDEERKYYWDKYLTDTNHSDIYSFFIEKMINLLKNEGLLGLITPDTWLQTPSFKSLRKKILSECKLTSMVSSGGEQVFGEALVSTMIMILQKGKEGKNLIEIRKIIDQKISLINKLDQESINSKKGINPFSSDEAQQILTKVFKDSIPLKDVVNIVGGLRTGDDKKFLKESRENSDCKKLLRGRNVQRYTYEWNGEWIWYKPDLMKNKQAAAPKSVDVFEAKR
ncbi:MAG: putative type IV restriction endonuclease, partial [Parcubacteria group bacterium Gr01-1014_73]